MNCVAVIDVVGLTPELIQKGAPFLRDFAKQGAMCPLVPVTPAVTCSVQSTILTGLPPSQHGCVANGWYFRELCEIAFWKQSNKLVSGEKIWETARRMDPKFTCANLFWWYNMYSSVDFSVTPRPMYPADGRKIPDIYTHPADLRDELSKDLGQFPLFHYWGPKANLISSEWIAQSTRLVFEKYHPTLTLVYLPHLDYNLQRLGPDHPEIARDVAAIDHVCQGVVQYFQERGVKVVVLSEYAMHPVKKSVSINRVLRMEKWISVREEMGRELLDAGASEAFAVADHQIAHVYVKQAKNIPVVKKLLEKCPGIQAVLDENGKKELGLDHPRSGELVALSESDQWFTYYYWLDDGKAPDFARTVDIHRKPGYDPVELFLDPSNRWVMAKIFFKLIRKNLGFRTLMDVIPLKPDLIQGSHGIVSSDSSNSPVFLTQERSTFDKEKILATEVKPYLLGLIYGK